MQTYIILLRGINVSGKNKLLMQDLRDLLDELKYQNVQTYIQSGNIILNSEEDKFTIAKKIKEGIELKFNYEVPVLVKTVAEWKKVIEKLPYPIDNDKILYFTFLSGTPEKTEVEVNGIKDDEYTIVDDVVYIYAVGGYGKTKLNNNLFENKLKLTATTRNFKTTHKLLNLAT